MASAMAWGFLLDVGAPAAPQACRDDAAFRYSVVPHLATTAD